MNTEGLGSLWRGLAPRGARIVGATFILSYVNESAGEVITGWRLKNTCMGKQSSTK